MSEEVFHGFYDDCLVRPIRKHLVLTAAQTLLIKQCREHVHPRQMDQEDGGIADHLRERVVADVMTAVLQHVCATRQSITLAELNIFSDWTQKEELREYVAYLETPNDLFAVGDAKEVLVEHGVVRPLYVHLQKYDAARTMQLRDFVMTSNAEHSIAHFGDVMQALTSELLKDIPEWR